VSRTILHVSEIQQCYVSRESQGTLISLSSLCIYTSVCLSYAVPVAGSHLSLHSCICQLCCHCNALGRLPNLAALHNLSCPCMQSCCLHTNEMCVLRVDALSTACGVIFAVHISNTTCREHIITVVRYATSSCANKEPGMCVYYLTFMLKGRSASYTYGMSDCL